MNNRSGRVIKIPNSILALAAIVLAAGALWSYRTGDRDAAMIMAGGCGIFLSAMTVNLPAMHGAMKVIAVTVLVTPFVAVLLLAFKVI